MMTYFLISFIPGLRLKSPLFEKLLVAAVMLCISETEKKIRKEKIN